MKDNYFQFLCVCFGSEKEHEDLIADWKTRRRKRELEDKEKERIREVKMFEFHVNEKEKDEFLQWLANYSWAHRNPNFTMFEKQFVKMSTGYVPIKMPKATENIKPKIPIYLVAERLIKKK